MLWIRRTLWFQPFLLVTSVIVWIATQWQVTAFLAFFSVIGTILHATVIALPLAVENLVQALIESEQQEREREIGERQRRE